MKKAVITFERVRDCPFWAEGLCYFICDKIDCEKNDLAKPPEDCPLEDAE